MSLFDLCTNVYTLSDPAVLAPNYPLQVPPKNRTGCTWVASPPLSPAVGIWGSNSFLYAKSMNPFLSTFSL